MNVIELTNEEYKAIVEARETIEEHNSDIKAQYDIRRAKELNSNKAGHISNDARDRNDSARSSTMKNAEKYISNNYKHNKYDNLSNGNFERKYITPKTHEGAKTEILRHKLNRQANKAFDSSKGYDKSNDEFIPANRHDRKRNNK